jgi:hypothetical protein
MDGIEVSDQFPVYVHKGLASSTAVPCHKRRGRTYDRRTCDVVQRHHAARSCRSRTLGNEQEQRGKHRLTEGKPNRRSLRKGGVAKRASIPITTACVASCGASIVISWFEERRITEQLGTVGRSLAGVVYCSAPRTGSYQSSIQLASQSGATGDARALRSPTTRFAIDVPTRPRACCAREQIGKGARLPRP